MIFNWVILFYDWLFKRRPIIHVAITNDNGQYEKIKANFKTSQVPRAGDMIYLNFGGPYYLVNRVIHDIGGARHIIWVVVNNLEITIVDSDKEKN